MATSNGMDSTDSFGFNGLKMFEVARECLPDDRKRTQNLLESKDDMLFVWNAKNCCVLSLNWMTANAKKDERQKYQTLIPSAPQNFTVEKILPSTEATFLALAGPRGLSILELPRRWGPNGQYQDGKECIICRSFNVDEHLFIENTNLDILQIRWHPASPTDSYILALLSDNSIRVYDVNSLRHVWRVGLSPSHINGGGSGRPTATSGAGPAGGVSVKLAYLSSLGDTAVDFDIAPPRVVSASANTVSSSTTTLLSTTTTMMRDGLSTTANAGSGKENLGKPKKSDTDKVEWPIVILRGDGNVYILCAGIDTDRPKLQGPISIFPQVDDNYGLDSCSLVVIPSLPPTIIIAESTGKTHHALLLEEEVPTERSLTELDSSLVIYPSEWYLQVLETVELELGLAGVDEARTYSCPIHLKRDLLNESRYFAYHNAGLHAITLDFTRQLSQFVEMDEDMCEKYPLFNTQSRAEYVVCTKALQKMTTNAVLGFALLQSPAGIILQLASGQIVTLDLISDHSLIRDWKVKPGGKSNSAADSPMKQFLKDAFQDRIQSILKSGTTQPILKLDKSAEPTPQESFELLTQATRMLREHYFVKHEKARQEIERRVHVLKLLKEQQLSEIDLLQQEKQQIRETAERLAENYEDICDKQNALFKRAQEVVRLATLRLPKGSFSERKYAEMIEKIATATKQLQKNVNQAKQKIAAQQVQIDQKQKAANERIVTLPRKQEEIIKQIIGDMNAQIEGFFKDIKKMNNILNLA
ncbi:nuclear pore complex protein Nup88 [Toxorhynchites rutilus septentrionalis]|uniref:nuclear pore complex protein Nup88 n=1 Tax=Toxorhynchites rutilus septentrionalis TaxID=329112 RepID=UPI0024796BB7|nr:nuclear pore complex protein Nup88 [Toxorhynchites rutilus septentrionalis]